MFGSTIFIKYSEYLSQNIITFNELVYLSGLDGGCDIDHDLLTGIYERIKASPLKPSPDHETQVMRVERKTVGKKNFAVSRNISLTWIT